MKIYDNKNDKVLSSITLYLSPNDAADLAWAADDLAKNPDNHHMHVTSEDGSVEITVAVHTEENFDQFDKRSKEIIKS